jgi:hypothetical protein
VTHQQRVRCETAPGTDEGRRLLHRKIRTALGLILPYVEQSSLTRIGCATRLLGDGSVRKSLAESARTVGTTFMSPKDIGQLNVLAMARGTTPSLFDDPTEAACDGAVANADDVSLQQTLTRR